VKDECLCKLLHKSDDKSVVNDGWSARCGNCGMPSRQDNKDCLNRFSLAGHVAVVTQRRKRR
jgi:hypothetical protein